MAVITQAECCISGLFSFDLLAVDKLCQDTKVCIINDHKLHIIEDWIVKTADIYPASPQRETSACEFQTGTAQ